MLRYLRRRNVLAAASAGAAFAALGVAVASNAWPLLGGSVRTRAGDTRELLTSARSLARLQAHATYAASTFPMQITVTPPDGTWAGAQYTASSHGRPAFGWVVVAHPGPQHPLGEIDIETAFGPTPSVPWILGRLRSAGGGATFGATKRVRLAGFPGWQIDGNVFGRFGHVFVPFTPRTGAASPPDNLRLDRGERFRVIVLDAHGKRVVVFLVSFALPPEKFPAFLESGTRLLASLRLSS